MRRSLSASTRTLQLDGHSHVRDGLRAPTVSARARRRLTCERSRCTNRTVAKGKPFVRKRGRRCSTLNSIACSSHRSPLCRSSWLRAEQGWIPAAIAILQTKRVCRQQRCHLRHLASILSTPGAIPLEVLAIRLFAYIKRIIRAEHLITWPLLICATRR